jgi:hypothetical protein
LTTAEFITTPAGSKLTPSALLLTGPAGLVTWAVRVSSTWLSAVLEVMPRKEAELALQAAEEASAKAKRVAGEKKTPAKKD